MAQFKSIILLDLQGCLGQRSLWVTADLRDERFPEGSVENNGERERDRKRLDVAHRCFIVLAGFEVSGDDRGR